MFPGYRRDVCTPVNQPKGVTVHGYKVKTQITLIFTDSFLANKLFMIKLFMIIDKMFRLLL